jgi:hypothetical protein
MENIIRINNNCVIVNNDLISYATKVAKVNHKKQTIKELGKWSATTSRHVSTAAKQLGYILIPFK